MTADEYLNAVISKNPALGKPDEEKVTLTCRGLRALIRQAHEMGVKQGIAVSQKVNSAFGNSHDIFGDAFPWTRGGK